jgi:hypothetical protein
MGRLTVEVSTRAQVDETLLGQLSERSCGCGLGAAHTFGSIPDRERETTVVAAIVDGCQFDEDAARDRREREPGD